MLKKNMTVLIASVFVLSSLFLMSSCTCGKRQVVAGEDYSGAEGATYEKSGDVSAEATGDRDREDLSEQERAEKLRQEIKGLETENIYFDFDRSELKSEAIAILKKKADWLKDNPGFSLRIEGHCDERGPNVYNLALGERRANAAWKYLNSLGISGERLSTISYGEEKPADPGHNPEAWAKNRRDEFKLSK